MFKVIYVVGTSSVFIVRVLYRVRCRGGRITETRSVIPDMLLRTLAFLGTVAVVLVYLLSDLLNFADYKLPVWAGWAGMLIFLVALWLLWCAHADLGSNWSDVLELRDGHELVTNGVYRRIRHPMYAAFWLWGIAQALLLQNWIAGFSNLASFGALYFWRVPREEQMMLDQFGGAYQAYMQRTGRLVPRIS